MSLNSKLYFGLGLVAVAGLFACAPQAGAKPRGQVAVQRSAAVSGLAATHNMRREGGRLCFADHFHYGSSAGKPTAAAAQAAAAGSWSSFVDFEYGSAWASYARASAKDMKCSQASIGWACEVSARPCR